MYAGGAEEAGAASDDTGAGSLYAGGAEETGAASDDVGAGSLYAGGAAEEETGAGTLELPLGYATAEEETGAPDELGAAAEDELGAGQKLVYHSQYALSSASSQVSAIHALTAELPQRDSLEVTPLEAKHEVQQVGVGVAEGPVALGFG